MPVILKYIGFLLLMIATSTSSLKAGSPVNDRVDGIQKKLQVTILIDQKISGTWKEVSYEIPTDTAAVLSYLELLDREYSKYPNGYFAKIGVRTIVICEQLMIREQKRAAIPDPYEGILFLSLGFDNDPTTYQIHVMHHELHHCAEYYHWKSMNYQWDSWNQINSPAFSYQGSGASAYDDSSKDWYAISRPQEGFINLYSTTACEEDRAEIVATIMTESEKETMDLYLQNDLILQQKVLLIKILLTEISGEPDSYWNQIFD